MVGQIIYHLSKRKWFRYPEEIEGFEVPVRYRPKSASTNRIGQGEGEGDRNGLETSRSSTIDTAVDDHDRNGDGDEPGDGAQKGKGEMIVVDWYGPDDPENPQNWYVTSFQNQLYVLMDVKVDKVYLIFNRKIKKTPS